MAFGDNECPATGQKAHENSMNDKNTSQKFNKMCTVPFLGVLLGSPKSGVMAPKMGHGPKNGQIERFPTGNLTMIIRNKV